MSSPSEQQPASSSRWWVRLCQWLFRGFLFIWFTVILGLTLNIAATLLTTKGFDPTGTSLEWIIEHLPVAFACGGGLLVLTVAAGVLGRQDKALMSQFDQRGQDVVGDQYNVDRELMLRRVEACWVKGVLNSLKDSLPEKRLIQLSFHTEPDMVENSWQEDIQEARRQPQHFPEEVSILQIYDELEDFLLLGRPGAGKTTLLLQLVDALISRARADKKKPVPVYFNLSSWKSGQSLEEWLIRELHSKYKVPNKLSHSWIQGKKIYLLLDGLDEVAETERQDCIFAINQYRRKYFVHLIVCSRYDDYQTLQEQTNTKLNLLDAVVIEDLSVSTAEHYLSNKGERFAAVQSALSNDQTLRELLTTPFMLSVFIKAYQDQPVAQDILRGSLEERRKHILATYVENVFKHRRERKAYSSDQTKRWLAWLASQMKRYNLSAFYLEQMQPYWLPTERARRRYRITMKWETVLLCALISGLIAGLLGGLLIGLRIGLQGVLPFGLPLGLLIGGVGGALIGITYRTETEIQPAEMLHWSWRGMWESLRTSTFLKHALFNGVSVGSVCILLTEVIVLLEVVVVGGSWWLLVAGLVSGSLGGLISGSIGGVVGESIENFPRYMGRGQIVITPKQRIGSPSVKGFLVGLASGLFSGLAFGLLLAGLFIFVLKGDLIIGLGSGLVLGLLAGVVNGLFVWLAYHVETELGPIQIVVRVGIHIVLSSVKNVRKGVPVGVAFGLLLGLFTWLQSRSVFYSALSGVIYGVLFGLYGTLIFGVIQSTINGLSSTMLDKRVKITPNEGIRRSARNGIFVGLVSCLVFGLLTGLLFELLIALQSGLQNGLFIALPGGLLVGLFAGLQSGFSYGGAAYIQHYLLRWHLWLAKCIPLNFVHFLNYATYRILLYRIGSGYTVHRLFLEYFASLDTQSLQQSAGQSTRQTSRMCSCGHRENRAGVRFCPKCGKSMT